MTLTRPSRRTRHPVQLDATVRHDQGRATPCKVSDFSLDGCCIAGFFRVGEEVEVSIRTLGTFRGQVRWAHLGKAGARFLRKPSAGGPGRDRLLDNQNGVAAVEYAILAAGIAMTLVLALTQLGRGVEESWSEVNTAVQGTAYNTN